MTKNKKIYEGPEIRIIEPLGRFEIVKKVVTHFIEFEKMVVSLLNVVRYIVV